MLAPTIREPSAGNRVTQTDDDNGALLRLVAARDRGAFAQLYRQLHARLYRYLFRMLHDHELTEELIDDVMLTVWDSAARFKGQSAVSTWVIGIAYRKGLKAYRQRSDRQARIVSDDLLPEAGDDDASSPEEHAGQAERFAHIELALARLSADHRSVMELCMLGYGYPEIAEIVDCPVNTVKTRMFHARRQLKEHLCRVENLNNVARGS